MEFNSIISVNNQLKKAQSTGNSINKMSTMLDLIIGQTNSLVCDIDKKYLDEKQEYVNKKIEESKNISSKNNNLKIEESKSHIDKISNNESNKKSATISRL